MEVKKHKWLQSSPGQVTCTKYLPECCQSLPQVCYIIDDYLVDSLHPHILQDACEHGASSDDLEFIFKRTVTNWEDVVNAAAGGGHLHVFEWIFSRQDGRGPCECDLRNVLNEAAAHGHLEVIKWLHGRGIDDINRTVSERAASNGHLLVVKWVNKLLDDNEYSYALCCAAKNGHLEAVQWLYLENCDYDPLDEKTKVAMASAAKRGHLEVLQWLHEQVTCVDVCTTRVMDAAVKGGHFNAVKWLFEFCEAGCSEDAATFAARNGDLPMLQWLHEHCGDIYRTNVMDHAARRGHVDLLKWLHNGYTSPKMDMSTGPGPVNVVKKWLHETRNGGCTTKAMTWAAKEGHLDVVKWLHENRSEGCDDLIMYKSVCNGHLEVVKWLVEHKPETCRDDLMECAAWGGHLDMVCYLDENTRQRSSEWGLAAAAKEGFVKVVPVLMRRCYKNDSLIDSYSQKLLSQLAYEDATASPSWKESYIMLGLFRSRMNTFSQKLLNQLSNEDATTVSPLWNESLKMLELFHSDEFSTCVSIMLDQALQSGYSVMVRQFFERRSEQEKCHYVAVAAEKKEMVLLRWLLENGAPFSVHVFYKTYLHESAWWLPERERVLLVCDALKNKSSTRLPWVLQNTIFEDYCSQNAIRCALKMADNFTEHWLLENLSNDHARSWCLPLEQGESDAETQSTARGLKRARRD